MSGLYPSRYRTVEFKTVEGREVPSQPWPQKFYISGWLMGRDEFEVRPLTVTGLVKGVGKNLVTMTYWRFLITLRILGFLTTREAEVLSWSQFTWRFWRHQMWWRLRIVKLAKRVLRRPRAAVIVWRRCGGYGKDSRIAWPYRKGDPRRWYWTTRHWWRMGRGRHLV